MKKVLILASVSSMIDQFNMTNIDILKNMGYEVHVAANFEIGNTSSKKRIEQFKKELEELNISYFHIDFSRAITKILTNIRAYKEVKKLIMKNRYEFIHCHSPIGGVCGRLAAYTTKTRVIYTAHGFHFYKGAPLKNWIIYYPIERFLARITNVLITINNEDYKQAQKFKTQKIEYTPGVGVDVGLFKSTMVDFEKKRIEIGVPSNAILIISVGELNKNKNHETIIRAIAELDNTNIYYAICGIGYKEKYLIDLSKSLNIYNRVKLLGYRSDIPEIYKISDIFAFPSRREGLGLAALEAMAAGLPIITSNVHGIVDYSINGLTGFNCNPDDVNGFKDAINMLVTNTKMRDEMGANNLIKVEAFDVNNVIAKMKKIYASINL